MGLLDKTRRSYGAFSQPHAEAPLVMAFAQPIPRPFNERGIWFYAPSAPGVFGLSNSKGWIHVSETDNIRASLLHYFRGHDPKLLDFDPTGFVFEECVHEVQKYRQAQLAAEYRPKYKQRLDSGARS